LRRFADLSPRYGGEVGRTASSCCCAVALAQHLSDSGSVTVAPTPRLSPIPGGEVGEAPQCGARRVRGSGISRVCPSLCSLRLFGDVRPRAALDEPPG